MQAQHRVYEKARQSRDPRFDGRFFIGVKTTGIYCRPVCPVNLPKPANITFYPSAAAAADAGFRPCLRCRPETAPGTPAWLGTSAIVSRGIRLIAEGALDEGNVEALAARLGLGSRHLDRLFMQHLGSSPLSIAQTRRLHFAKRLIDETRLKMTDVALSAGYGSVRRFNAHIKSVYNKTPRDLRAGRKHNTTSDQGFVFHLAYRPPFDWRHLIDFLAVRACPGVEQVRDDCYQRIITINGQPGRISVTHAAADSSIRCHLDIANSTQLLFVIEKIKRIFDLTADYVQIEQELSRDKNMRPLVKKYTGTRVAGSWDGFEIAVRAVVGQQVSVQGATTVMGRIVEQYGETLDAQFQHDSLTRLFPSPEALSTVNITKLSMPKARAQALKTLATEVAAGHICFAADTASLIEQLVSIKGIGQWTAQYIAMRACSDPDAFLNNDLILLKAAEKLFACPLSATQLADYAEAWRPWRAYAAMILWRYYSATDG